MGVEIVRVVAAVIERGGRYLITQRTPKAVLPLLWEFPGGRVEAGETAEDALRREVMGRIGVAVEIVDKLGEHVHEYVGYEVHMTLFACRLPLGAEPAPLTVRQVRWVTSAQLDDHQFPPADQATMDLLLGRTRTSPTA